MLLGLYCEVAPLLAPTWGTRMRSSLDLKHEETRSEAGEDPAAANTSHFHAGFVPHLDFGIW